MRLERSLRLAKEAEFAAGLWMARNGVAVTRIALGIVFVWFGLLKFCPGLCDVEVIAQKTLGLMTFHLLSPAACIQVLAVAECFIGVGLVSGRLPRLTVSCLLLHLAGTFLPLVLFPADCWKHFPYAPTLVGQYILKNIVLMSAGMVVGAEAFLRAKAPRAAILQARWVGRPVDV